MTSAAPVALTLALALVALTACGRAGDQDQGGGDIRMAVPAPSPSRGWSAVLEDAEASTDLHVILRPAAGDGAEVAALDHKTIDLGLYSSQAALVAVRRAEGEIFARATPPPGADGERAVLIAAARSKIAIDRVLKCDRSLSLGLGEPLAVPALATETYLLAPRDTWPARCFRQLRAGTPAADLAAVAGGQLDLAVESSAFLARSRAEGRRDAAGVRQIWSSPILPRDPLVWRRDLDPAVKELLRQFFLTYGQGTSPAAGRERAKLAAIGVGGFEPADDSLLLPVREMEATHVWLQAEAGGDKARIEAARKALQAVTDERQALEARTRAPAAGQ